MKGMTVMVSVGEWGGVYLHRGYSKRLCLGWLSITFVAQDMDKLLERLIFQNRLTLSLGDGDTREVFLHGNIAQGDLEMAVQRAIQQVQAARPDTWLVDDVVQAVCAATGLKVVSSPFVADVVAIVN